MHFLSDGFTQGDAIISFYALYVLILDGAKETGAMKLQYKTFT